MTAAAEVRIRIAEMTETDGAARTAAEVRTTETAREIRADREESVRSWIRWRPSLAEETIQRKSRIKKRTNSRNWKENHWRNRLERNTTKSKACSH